MKTQFSYPEEEKLSFTKFIQKTQEETQRVQSLLESIENESTFKSVLSQSRSHTGLKSAEASRSRVNDLDQEIINMKNKILTQKKQICQQRADDQNAMRKIKSLEQALQSAQQKYNSAISRNKLIRDNIDTLRKEQKIFKDLCKDLMESISESKEKMEELTDIGSKTRKNREVAENEINDLESQAEQEEVYYHRSIVDLKNLIKKEKNMQGEIGSVKMSASVSQDIKVLETEEEDISKKIVRLSWKIAQDKANMIMNLNKLEEYEVIIKKFQELTGVSNYQSLLRHYQSTKDHNSTLTKYVEGLTNELDQLESQLAQLKDQVMNCKIISKQNSQETPKTATNLQVQDSRDEIDFHHFKLNVDEAFIKIGCKEIKDSQNLSTNELVIAKIREIEKRCHELVSVKATPAAESRFRSSYKIEVEVPAFQDKEKDVEEDDGYLTWQDFGSKDVKKLKNKKK